VASAAAAAAVVASAAVAAVATSAVVAAGAITIVRAKARPSVASTADGNPSPKASFLSRSFSQN
jgi:hypothetical protein